MLRNHHIYDEEFKRNASRLSFESRYTVKEVADSLGITEIMLYRWRKIYNYDKIRSTGLPKSING